MADNDDTANATGSLTEEKIIEQTRRIDFQAVKQHFDETEALVNRHRIKQEKLDLKISV